MWNPWHVYIFVVTNDLEGSMKIVGIDEQPLTFEAMAMVWVRETHWSSSAGKSEFPWRDRNRSREWHRRWWWRFRPVSQGLCVFHMPSTNQSNFPISGSKNAEYWDSGNVRCDLSPALCKTIIYFIYIMILYACACSAQHDLHESAICQNSTKEFN